MKYPKVNVSVNALDRIDDAEIADLNDLLNVNENDDDLFIEWSANHVPMKK